ncbi:MAG: XTP/dITP diphosphatase [Thermodesulfobacteriota bacterium]|nr:MAG: XTP/dITP diphosphatase [Thermodesulfobacteriota bacterium]
MKLVLATKNRNKVRELKALLEGLDVEVLTLDDFPNLIPPPEDGGTFKENALIKARWAASETGLPALADDSGLEVDFLGGRPGVFSARYAGPDADDRKNYLKLLEEMRGVEEGMRKARFKCVLAFVTPEGEEHLFCGTLEGSIAERPSGNEGFGYDPVFLVGESKKTAAELTPAEKNAISHRSRAFKKFKEWLGGR